MRFDSKDHYPKYYKQVFIEYYENDYLEIGSAYLSVNDDGEYIWTLEYNDQIIKDEQVVNWTDFENKVII